MTLAQAEARALAAVLAPLSCEVTDRPGAAWLEVRVRVRERVESHVYPFAEGRPEQWAQHWQQAAMMYLRPGGEA